MFFESKSKGRKKACLDRKESGKKDFAGFGVSVANA
jgi:hypothetical protein